MLRKHTIWLETQLAETTLKLLEVLMIPACPCWAGKPPL